LEGLQKISREYKDKWASKENPAHLQAREHLSNYKVNRMIAATPDPFGYLTKFETAIAEALKALISVRMMVKINDANPAIINELETIYLPKERQRRPNASLDDLRAFAVTNLKETKLRALPNPGDTQHLDLKPAEWQLKAQYSPKLIAQHKGFYSHPLGRTKIMLAAQKEVSQMKSEYEKSMQSLKELSDIQTKIENKIKSIIVDYKPYQAEKKNNDKEMSNEEENEVIRKPRV